MNETPAAPPGGPASDRDPGPHCLFCGRPLTPPPTGRPPSYCPTDEARYGRLGAKVIDCGLLDQARKAWRTAFGADRPLGRLDQDVLREQLTAALERIGPLREVLAELDARLDEEVDDARGRAERAEAAAAAAEIRTADADRARARAEALAADAEDQAAADRRARAAAETAAADADRRATAAQRDRDRAAADADHARAAARTAAERTEAATETAAAARAELATATAERDAARARVAELVGELEETRRAAAAHAAAAADRVAAANTALQEAVRAHDTRLATLTEQLGELSGHLAAASAAAAEHSAEATHARRRYVQLRDAVQRAIDTAPDEEVARQLADVLEHDPEAAAEDPVI